MQCLLSSDLCTAVVQMNKNLSARARRLISRAGDCQKITAPKSIGAVNHNYLLDKL